MLSLELLAQIITLTCSTSPTIFYALKQEAPQVQFSVNGNEYSTCYYLVDGIYLEWAAFIKTIALPQIEKHRLFAQDQ